MAINSINQNPNTVWSKQAASTYQTIPQKMS